MNAIAEIAYYLIASFVAIAGFGLPLMWQMARWHARTDTKLDSVVNGTSQHCVEHAQKLRDHETRIDKHDTQLLDHEQRLCAVEQAVQG